MSFNKFITDLDELERVSYESGFDISKFFMSDKEIMKKLLAEKTPELSEEDIELMSEAAFSDDENETKDEKRARKKKEKEDLDIIKEQRKEKSKEDKKERIKKLKEIYKTKLESLKNEIKELKDKIRSAAFQFFNKFKEVSKAFILALIKTMTSLPGAIAMIVSPPWNVPGAITILLVVIIDYLDILSKIQSIVPFFKPLRGLPTVIEKSKLNEVGLTLDLITLGLKAFYGPILGLKKFIDAIFKFIKSLFGNRKEKIFKQASKKLKKLGHIEKVLSNKRGDDRGLFELEPIEEVGTKVKVRVYSYDEDDDEEILSLLDQFKISNTQKWGGKQHVSDYRQDVNKLISQINKLEADFDSLDKDEFIKSIDTSEFDQFVYDINLPDGTIIPNISEEGLEYYKNKFDLQIRDITLSTSRKS
jgi:hypothetical protein